MDDYASTLLKYHQPIVITSPRRRNKVCQRNSAKIEEAEESGYSVMRWKGELVGPPMVKGNVYPKSDER